MWLLSFPLMARLVPVPVVGVYRFRIFPLSQLRGLSPLMSPGAVFRGSLTRLWTPEANWSLMKGQPARTDPSGKLTIKQEWILCWGLLGWVPGGWAFTQQGSTPKMGTRITFTERPRQYCCKICDCNPDMDSWRRMKMKSSALMLLNTRSGLYPCGHSKWNSPPSLSRYFNHII